MPKPMKKKKFSKQTPAPPQKVKKETPAPDELPETPPPLEEIPMDEPLPDETLDEPPLPEILPQEIPVLTDSEEPKCHGTIGPNPDFKADWAAERLKKSMRGIGSDEKMIIKILVSHDNLQRAEIEKKYKTMFGRDLIEDLKSELGGHFEETVLALMMSKYDLLVKALNDSFRLIGSDANTLTEVLCCRSADDVESLCWWYEKNFSDSLEDDIEANLQGDFRSFMLSLVTGGRPPEPTDEEADEDEARVDAQDLYDAGVGYNSSTDESAFINILNNRTFAHLAKVFSAYENFSDEPIEESVKTEFKGDLRDGLLAIVKRVKDPYGFFAERLNECMRGSGTDDKAVIRIIVSRSEEDLENIKERYQEMYGNSLANDVKEDTGGDYAKLLLAIINNKK